MDGFSANGMHVAFACVVLAIFTDTRLSTAQAQTVPSSARTFAGNLVQEPAQPFNVSHGGSEGDEPGTPGPVFEGARVFDGEVFSAQVTTGPLDVICESIFGAASVDEWRPLDLSTFFSEGWDRPYARSPAGTNGAPKQNWFGSADGIFSRLSSINFFYTNGLTNNTGLLISPFPWAPVKPSTSGNQYWASYNLYVPLNQRMELLVVVPFIASNTTSPSGHYIANFGDLTISERFRLIERRNFTLQAALTERTPTGQTDNGNDINYITPSAEFWWNFAPRWVLRGGTGLNIDTGRTSATSTYFTNAALGRYLTTSDARYFKEMVAHVAVATMSDVLGRKDHITEVYVAPGLRFNSGWFAKWSILGAVQVPVSGPHPYALQPNFSLSRNY